MYNVQCSSALRHVLCMWVLKSVRICAGNAVSIAISVVVSERRSRDLTYLRPYCCCRDFQAAKETRSLCLSDFMACKKAAAFAFTFGQLVQYTAHTLSVDLRTRSLPLYWHHTAPISVSVNVSTSISLAVFIFVAGCLKSVLTSFAASLATAATKGKVHGHLGISVWLPLDS